MLNQRTLLCLLAGILAFAQLQGQTPRPKIQNARPAFRTADHNDLPSEIHRTNSLDSLVADTITHTLLFYTAGGLVERKDVAQLDTLTQIMEWTNRYDWTYDSIGQNTELVSKVYNLGNWDNFARDTYTYDSLSYKIAHDNYQWNATVWDLFEQQAWAVSLDSLGRLDSLLEQFADAPNFNWADVELNEYHYNASNEWDTITTTPLPSGVIHRAVYDSWYDFANDLPSTWYIQVNFFQWLNQIHFDRTYGTFGSYDTRTDVWGGSAWDSTFKSSVVHDAHEHSILEESYQLDSGNWVLASQYTFVNSYDGLNQMTRREAFLIEFQFNDTTEYVDHFTYLPLSVFHENPGTGIQVWPNPSSGVFNLELPIGMGGARIQVMDALGRMRMSGYLPPTSSASIELPESWAPGAYFFLLEGANGDKQTGRLLLQR